MSTPPGEQTPPRRRSWRRPWRRAHLRAAELDATSNPPPEVGHLVGLLPDEVGLTDDELLAAPEVAAVVQPEHGTDDADPVTPDFVVGPSLGPAPAPAVTPEAVEDATWAAQWAARPKLRGWLHAAALPGAVAATSVLIVRRRQHRLPVAAYAAGLCGMLATSAGYHRLTRTEEGFRWSQPADHAMIFAAIAGSATPVAATVLPPRAARWTIVGLWAGAAGGAVARIRGLRTGTNGGASFYAVLGWAGAALFPLVISRHGIRNALLLGAGGVSYTAGAVMFARRRPDPFPEVFGYHEVWHVATLVAAVCHLVAIADITRDPAPVTVGWFRRSRPDARKK